MTVNAIPHYDLFSFLTLIGKGGNSHFFNYRLHVANFVKLSLLMGEKVFTNLDTTYLTLQCPSHPVVFCTREDLCEIETLCENTSAYEEGAQMG